MKDLKGKGISISLLGETERTEITVYFRTICYDEFLQQRFFGKIPLSPAGMCLAAAAKKTQEEVAAMGEAELRAIGIGVDEAVVVQAAARASYRLSPTASEEDLTLAMAAVQAGAVLRVESLELDSDLKQIAGRVLDQVNGYYRKVTVNWLQEGSSLRGHWRKSYAIFERIQVGQGTRGHGSKPVTINFAPDYGRWETKHKAQARRRFQRSPGDGSLSRSRRRTRRLSTGTVLRVLYYEYDVMSTRTCR